MRGARMFLPILAGPSVPRSALLGLGFLAGNMTCVSDVTLMCRHGLKRMRMLGEGGNPAPPFWRPTSGPRASAGHGLHGGRDQSRSCAQTLHAAGVLRDMTTVLNQLFGKTKGFQGDVEFWHGAERAGWLEKQGRAIKH